MSKILIIEDEEAIADLEKDYLELSGFEDGNRKPRRCRIKKGIRGRV